MFPELSATMHGKDRKKSLGFCTEKNAKMANINLLRGYVF